MMMMMKYNENQVNQRTESELKNCHSFYKDADKKSNNKA